MIYVMRYKGTEQLSSEDVVNKLKVYNIKILDKSSLPQMAKVETTSVINPCLKEDWDFFPEKKYKVPSTRRKVKK